MKYYFLFLTVFLFCFSSCKPIQPLDVKEVESVKLEKLTGDVADIAIGFKLSNPNSMNFKVTSHHLDIYLNDKPIGVLVNDHEIDIPANSDKSYIAHAEAPLKNITGNLSMLLGIIAKGEADISIRGYIKVKRFIFTKKIPVDITETVSAEDLNFLF